MPIFSLFFRLQHWIIGREQGGRGVFTLVADAAKGQLGRVLWTVPGAEHRAKGDKPFTFAFISSTCKERPEEMLKDRTQGPTSRCKAKQVEDKQVCTKFLIVQVGGG